ncbi:hypothetical protein D3C76_418770 [compost metagenome]
MATQAVAEHAAEGAVVDLAGAGIADVITLDQAQVGRQAAHRQRLAGHQAEEVLAVDVFQLGHLVLGADSIVEAVIDTRQVEVVGFDIAGIALVLAVHANVLAVGGVPCGVLVQARQGELQVVYFFRGQQRPMEQGGQQAAIVVFDQRHVRHHRAVLEDRVGHFDLGRQAHLRVLIRRMPRVVARRRQQAAVTVRRAGIELYPEQADCINANAYRPLGKAGLHIEDKTLRPLFALGGALAGTAVAITEVAVEVDIPRFDLGAAVFKKTGGLGIDAGTQKEQAGNTAPRGVREGGKHAWKHPERKAKKQPAANTCCGTATRPNSRRASSEMIAQRLWLRPLDLGLEPFAMALELLTK